MKHIGIVDITTLGTTLCQLALIKSSSEFNGAGDRLQYTVHSLPFSSYLNALNTLNGDWEKVADLVLQSISCLENAGADFIIIPNNTGHYAFDLIAAQSPLPVLNMIELVAKECARLSIRNPTVLGTDLTMENGLYNQAMASEKIQTMIPNKAQRELLNQMIRQELVPQQPNQLHIDQIVKLLSLMDCDAYLLACSELPTVFNESNLGKPCINPTLILVRAALAYAQ